jgi:hypothetical protein
MNPSPQQRKAGLKRLQYFTELESRPNEFYIMKSYRHPELKEDLSAWIKTFQILPLKEKINLPWEKHAWLDPNNNIFLLNAHTPELTSKEYATAKPLANMLELLTYTRTNIETILKNL